MPKLWDETIQEHRRSVREATLDSTAKLVAQRGLRAVTMSEIAEKAGIGRATLYKYFPDVETILSAWHQRLISRHLEHLNEIRAHGETAIDRLEAVLTAYAYIQRERARHHHDQPHGRELEILLHSDPQVEEAQRDLHHLIRELVEDAISEGAVRGDIGTTEVAGYAIHALDAARCAPSEVAACRLVTLTLAGMRPTN